MPSTVNVNLQDTVNGVTGTQALTVNDIPSSLKGVVNNMITNIPDSLGGSSWTYNTLEFAFNKRFGAGLFLNSNFDYQWRRDTPQSEREQQQPELGSDRYGQRCRQHLLRAGVFGVAAAEHDGVGREGLGALPVQVRRLVSRSITVRRPGGRTRARSTSRCPIPAATRSSRRT